MPVLTCLFCGETEGDLRSKKLPCEVKLLFLTVWQSKYIAGKYLKKNSHFLQYF